MTSLANRIRSGDSDALDDADVIEWCMDDPIGRALVDRVRVLRAEAAEQEEAKFAAYAALDVAEDRVRALEAELCVADRLCQEAAAVIEDQVQLVGHLRRRREAVEADADDLRGQLDRCREQLDRCRDRLAASRRGP